MGQPSRVTFAIAEQGAIERTARQLTRLRDTFLSTGNLEVHLPRELILQSWERCRALQVDADRQAAVMGVGTQGQLNDLRDANGPLIAAAQPVFSRLCNLLGDNGYVLTLNDFDGYMLSVGGNPALGHRLERINFVPGSVWNEVVAGTNSMGTALTTGRAVQLAGAEHYCEGWQGLSCTAAPIRHPSTGAIVGLLNATGEYRLVRSFLISYIATAALEVSERLQPLVAAPAQPIASSRRYGGWSPSAMNSSAIDQNMASSLVEHERRVQSAERFAVAAGLISASLSLDVTASHVCEQTGRMLNLSAAVVHLYEQRHVYVWSEHPLSGSDDIVLRAFVQRAERATNVADRGEPVLVADSRMQPWCVTLPERGLHEVALFPLTTARGQIGTLFALRGAMGGWTPDEVRHGLALSLQSATAIENARMFEVVERHNRSMQALTTVSAFLRTLVDPGACFAEVLERVATVMSLPVAMAMLVDQRDGADSRVFHYGLPTSYAVQAKHFSLLLAMQQDQGPSVRYLQAHDPVCTPLCDVFATAAVRELLIVPLYGGGASLGVLMMGATTQRLLTDDDAALLSTIAQQLGLALHNFQLMRAASEMEALRQADQLKSEFLAAVSHDLRSPLTAIRASVESLLDSEGQQHVPEREHVLYNVSSQALRLGRLVDQLLDLSRIEAGALRLDRDWSDLATLIDDVLEKFAGVHPARVIECNVQTALSLQYIDPVSIAQVLWNLLENAHKYSPPEASICIDVASGDNEVLLEISDCGPGVPLSDREAIFGRFYRLRRDRGTHVQGSGLGLAICRGVITAHGGRIWVEDREGGGSRFVVTLPDVPDTTTALEHIDDEYSVSDVGAI